jgi:kynurenine 3-monooxygenase
MVPFYGQGMNSGLEDVRVLFSILDKYSSTSTNSRDNITLIANPPLIEHQRAHALEEFSAIRTIDGAAINDLALQNYIEMRASVISPVYRLRKFLEETLSVYVPSLGWQTKYSRVSFGNERYSEVIRQSEHQGKILLRGLLGLVVSPVVVAAAVGWWRWRAAYGGTRWFMKWQGMAAGRTT